MPLSEMWLDPRRAGFAYAFGWRRERGSKTVVRGRAEDVQERLYWARLGGIGECVSTETFLILLGIGAAVIAFWVALRFPNYGPSSIGRALIHVGVALGIGWFAPTFVADLAARGLGMAMLAIFLVVFPVLVYTFLAGAWVLRLAHDALARYR